MNGPGPGGDFFAFLLDSWDGTQGFAHAQVVHQHTVIQIDFQITGSQRVQGLILIVLAFKNGFTEFGGLFLVRGTVGTLQAIGDVGDFVGIVTQIVEYHVRGFWRIPMQIHERLERALVVGLAGVLPIDRTIRVHLHVVVVEIIHEILADTLAQHLFDVGDVRGQILLAERHGKEPAEPCHDIIFEAVRLRDRNDIVRVRLE